MTMLTEEGLIAELGQYGWVGEREAYYLPAEALAELVPAAGLQEHPERQEFETPINGAVADFCLGLMRYHGKKPDQKITTALAQKASIISRAAEALLAEIGTLSDDELYWIFGHAFADDRTRLVPMFTQWLQYTGAFERYASDAPIEVKRSTPPVMRDFTSRAILILEQFTGKPILRRRADGEEADAQMIHDFIVTLWHHLSADVKQILPQLVSSFEGAVREAIETLRAAENEEAKTSLSGY